METIKTICDNKNNVLAIVIKRDHVVTKTEFFSDPDYSQQIGIIKYPTGGIIRNHCHNLVKREVFFTQEVLIIRKGSVRVDIYDSIKEFVESIILNQYDTVFLISGGHGFSILDDCEMLEIKQGPYGGVEQDKVYF